MTAFDKGTGHLKNVLLCWGHPRAPFAALYKKCSYVLEADFADSGLNGRKVPQCGRSLFDFALVSCAAAANGSNAGRFQLVDATL
jgi:hypothetical protein